MNCYLGFDGGGTKTLCIALDDEGNIVGQGNAGPSNPLRVGYEAACAALQLSSAMAITEAKSVPEEIRGVCAGLGGAGRRNVVEEMRGRLSQFWAGVPIQILTDAEAALETAVGTGIGVVLIAGTGSIALGRNARGEVARAGGYGPWIGDAGSAFDIGRQAVLAVARARDFAGPATSLATHVLFTLECRIWDDVVEKVAAKPGSVFPRLVPAVMQAADEGDAAARAILARAALDLANTALTVVGRLGLKDEQFPLARAGGVFGRSYLLDARVDDLILRTAAKAQVSQLKDSPALGAARAALRQAKSQGAGHARRIR